MNLETHEPITELLRRYNLGDREVWHELLPYVYEDLRRLARLRMRNERSGHTLSATGLVNECFMRLVENRKLAASCRNDFIALVSQTMKRVLVDHARRKKRLKRGPEPLPLPAESLDWLTDHEADEVIALNDALDRLAARDPRAAQVVELRFFGGLSLEETAHLLQLSVKTVQRSWTATRAWLRSEVNLVLNMSSPPLQGRQG